MTLGRAVCGCSRGHGSPWQPPRQRVGTGAPAGPWCDRHELWDTRAHPAPSPWPLPPLAIPSPEDGWARTRPGVPCFVSLPPPWALGGLWDGARGLGTGMGMGTKGLSTGAMLQVGMRGLPCPGKSSLSPLPASLPQALGRWRHRGAAWGAVPLSRVLEPSPTQPLSPPPHTRVPMAPTHNLGRVLLCRQRNTPG